ncbi:MAG: hypothetical protein GY930_09165 [bacterium]|nr:hypothetical protein [bacterium]
MIAVSALLLMAGLAPMPSQDISLEELLRRAREAQTEAQGPIRQEVSAAIERLSTPGLRENTLKSIAYNLAKLGPAAGPMLVPALHPGDTLPAPYQERSDQVLFVLQSFEDLGTTLALLKTVNDGSPAHAQAALKALRTSTHHSIVAEALLPTIAKGSDSPLSIPALATLSNLDSQEAALWLLDCTERQDGAGEVAALQALTAARNPAVAKTVLQTLKRTGRPAAGKYLVLNNTLRYFASVPSLLAKDDTYRRPLLDLANGVRAQARGGQSGANPASGRRLILNTLLNVPGFKLSGDLRKQLWNWEKSYDSDAQTILAVLAKGGDSKGKREYLANHNTRVKTRRKARGKEYASALLGRGQAFHTIGDYRSALRDAEKGIKEYEAMRTGGEYRPAIKALRILAARASAAGGKFRSTADFLEKARLDSKEAAKWAKAAEFQEFLKSRYGDILRP